MSTTYDLIDAKRRLIKRSYIEHDGTVSCETTLRPAVLPFTTYDFRTDEKCVYVEALRTIKNKAVIETIGEEARTADPYFILKGEVYRLNAIYRNGQCVVEGLDDVVRARPMPMEFFVLYLEGEHKFLAQTPLLETFGSKNETPTGEGTTSELLPKGEGTADQPANSKAGRGRGGRNAEAQD